MDRFRHPSGLRSLIVFVVIALSLPAVSQDSLQFAVMDRIVVEARLKDFGLRNSERAEKLKALFGAAGCNGELLTQQSLKQLKEPNIICTLPGHSDGVILVGAHYDHAKRGDGVVDNWSGASLLPSFFQSLTGQPRWHTYVFVGFSGEEKGLIGSGYFARQLTPISRSKIEAMINLDTLGLGPTEVWVSHGDARLIAALTTVAHALKLPLAGMDVEGVGSSDSESFADVNIPSVTVHSLTRDTLRLLHSDGDNLQAIRMDDYYDSYRLLTAYLTFLDRYLRSPAPGAAAGMKHPARPSLGARDSQ